ncbi:MAG: hypothetical protein ABFS56_13420 [Pseudomonadota bacterium]
MQEQTQITEPQETEQAAYQAPQITVYKEEELLQTVAVLGCSPFN